MAYQIPSYRATGEKTRLEYDLWREQLDGFIKDYPDYFRNCEDKLEKLSDVRRGSQNELREFFVVAASINLKRKWNFVEASVVVPDNPLVAWTREQRRCLEMHIVKNQGIMVSSWPAREEMARFVSHETQELYPVMMRFSAGGGLTILKVLKEGVTPDSTGQYQEEKYEEFIVVSQKDGGPVVHRNCLCPSSGLAETEEDWFNPILIVVGECVEEVRLRSRLDDSWFLPEFEGNFSNDLNDRVDLIYKQHFGLVEDYEKHPPGTYIKDRETENSATPVYCQAEVISIGDDVLTINGEPIKDKHLLVLDADYGAIDVMAAVRITIPCPLSALRVLDGESFYSRISGKRELLNRNTFAFTIEEFVKVIEGQEAKVAAFFGRNHKGDRWLDGVPAKLTAKPPINPPLYVAGPALLKKVYGIEVKPFAQGDITDPNLQPPQVTILE